MYDMPLGVSPLPSTDDQHRMRLQAQRRRILTGRWQGDLLDTIRRTVGTDRADAWKVPDTSSNPARQYCQAVSELYTSPPVITHEFDPGAAAIVSDVLARAKWTSMMQRLQPLTVGVRQGILRVDMIGPNIRLREVDPAYVTAVGGALDGGQPVKVCEYRRREDPRTMARNSAGRPIPGTAARDSWVREIWDTRSGTLTLIDESGEDVTDIHYEDTSYPYWALGPDGEPRPIMPYVFFHAQQSGEIFGGYTELDELFTATLISGSLWSLFGHRCRNSSFPQRYMVNLQPAGLRPSTTYPNGDGRRDIITADPAVVLSLEVMEEAQGQPMIGAFPDGGDLSSFVEAVNTYDRHAIATAGIDAADIQRVDGDPRSGYAISLSASGKREAKRQFAPTFLASDLKLIAVVSRMLRGAVEMGRVDDPSRWATLPGGGYDINYSAIGLSDDESKALVDEVTRLTAAGILSTVEARAKLIAAGYFDDVVVGAEVATDDEDVEPDEGDQ